MFILCKLLTLLLNTFFSFRKYVPVMIMYYIQRRHGTAARGGKGARRAASLCCRVAFPLPDVRLDRPSVFADLAFVTKY